VVTCLSRLRSDEKKTPRTQTWSLGEDWSYVLWYSFYFLSILLRCNSRTSSP